MEISYLSQASIAASRERRVEIFEQVEILYVAGSNVTLLRIYMRLRYPCDQKFSVLLVIQWGRSRWPSIAQPACSWETVPVIISVSCPKLHWITLTCAREGREGAGGDTCPNYLRESVAISVSLFIHQSAAHLTLPLIGVLSRLVSLSILQSAIGHEWWRRPYERSGTCVRHPVTQWKRAVLLSTIRYSVSLMSMCVISKPLPP